MAHRVAGRAAGRPLGSGKTLHRARERRGSGVTPPTNHLTSKGQVVKRAAKKKRGAAQLGAIAKLRGRATVRMKTEEIMALTRGP